MQSFAYRRASSTDDAVATVSAGGTGHRFLGGGTTLYDLMKLGVETPEVLVDVSRVDGLRQVELRADELVVGSAARMADVAAHPEVRGAFPALAESLDLAASQQLRNMATVGGNLLQRTRCFYFRGGAPFACNKRAPGSGCSALVGSDREHAVLGGSDSCIAVSPSDWAVALVALGAVVDVSGPDRERSLAVAELLRPPGDRPDVEHTLSNGELIVSIRVPRTRAALASTYRKVRDRESYAFALASAAVGLDLDADGVVQEARVALGGLATVPWRAVEAEEALVGRRPTPSTAAAAGDAALRAARPGRENAFKVELGRRTVADAILVAAGRSRL